MKRSDWTFVWVMCALAAFVWLRDLGWVSTMDDTLPILVALPMFVWLEWPWKFQENEFKVVPFWLGLTAITFLGGIILNLTILFTIGWCFLLWSWIKQRVTPEFHGRLLKLMVLPVMAFPWITLDGHLIGWYFRLSGAQTTGDFYSMFNYDVRVEGTQLWVNELPISVEAACSGMNTLQSMMIAGSVLAYILLGHTKRYWLNIPFLVVIAWLANTLRIIMLTGAALFVSPEFAMGAFHEPGGWVVLFIMFLGCWGWFTLQIPKPATEPRG